MQFVAVGDGPDRRSLETLAIQLGLEGRVVWAGERADIVGVMSALDIMVSSSVSESFANVIGEAMACGVPCVVTDVGDSATIVGSTGAAVPPRSPVALADALLDLAGRFARDERRLRAEARARIDARFALDAMVEPAERLLADISRRSKASP
jgi:glycosyltransferase involved in cell wall biosynthesis